MPKFGDTREDGYRFRGYTDKRKYESWLSPAAWEARAERLRRWRKQDYYKRIDKHRSYAKEWGHAARRDRPSMYMLIGARVRAKQLGLEFSITAKDVVIPEFCPVFGVPLEIGGGDNAPSLDRIVGSKGYVPGNVIVVSHRANQLKRDASVAEMLTLAYFYEALTRPLERKSAK